MTFPGRRKRAKESPEMRLDRLPGIADLTMSMHLVRHRIVQMSVTVFAKKGVDRTRVEDLLKAAKLSRRTFYKYFRNKQDVLAELYDTACKALLGALQISTGRSGSLQERIRAGVDTYLEFHRSAGPLMRVLHEEAIRSESPLSDRRKVMHDEVVDWLATLTPEGEDVDPLLLRCLIWSLENLSLHLLTETELSDEDIEGAKHIMYKLCTSVLTQGT